MDTDWSFSEASRTETLWGPHGYHRYPAKFIPHLVRRIIGKYAEPGDLLGDLFIGSGTTGIEAIRAGYRFYGADINAVAQLISQAKCIPLNPSKIEVLSQDLGTELQKIQTIGRQPLSVADKEAINAIDISRASSDERWRYWFPKKHRDILSQILSIIDHQDDEQFRIFLLCAFSNILKRCSIWLSGSTKAQKDITKTLSDPITEFFKQVKDMCRRNKLYWDSLSASGINPLNVPQNICIERQDTRKLHSNTPHLDLLVTSPPYATCYEYSEIHQLTQLWFEKFKIIASAPAKQDWIGSRSGAATKGLDNGEIEIIAPSAIQALSELESIANTNAAIIREVRALRRYFADMQRAIWQMANVVNSGKYMVLVIGDSRKRNVTIPTSHALTEMAREAKFELVEKIERKVPGRVLVSTRDRKSGRFSSTDTSDVEVYPDENILVFKRR
jgi:DNA modification methylase